MSSGRIRKSRYGVYALPDAPADVEQAVVLGGKLTCVSAAIVHGLWVRNKPVKPHVLVTKKINARDAVLHRRDSYRCPRAVVDPAEAVRQATRCLPWEESLIVAESAVARGILTVGQVLAGVDAIKRRHFEFHLEGSSQSLLEVEVRRLLRSAGYSVAAQVQILGVGVVDLLVEDCLVVELDGFTFHSGRAEYRSDRRRWNALTAQGYQTLRFTYEMVLGNPEFILAQVAQTLGERR